MQQPQGSHQDICKISIIQLEINDIFIAGYLHIHLGYLHIHIGYLHINPGYLHIHLGYLHIHIGYFDKIQLFFQIWSSIKDFRRSEIFTNIEVSVP